VDARRFLTRGVSTGLRLGRGTADRMVRLAGPSMGKVADTLASRVRRPGPSTTATFTPSRKADPEPAEATGPAEPHEAPPSPLTVARNIAPPRPQAKPARAPKPQSVPGAKLPPPRPSTS
jgi:hypothetical protein